MTTQNEMAHRAATATATAAPERTQDRPSVAPLIDIYENNDELLLVADVPGATREGVSIDFERNQLTLTARRDGALGPRGRQAPDYYRAFMVPSGIDAQNISAELKDGVLRVHLPKSSAVKPRRIEVRAG